MKKDFIYTLGTNIIVMISGLLVYKLAIFFFGIQSFALYSLSKRIIAFLYPVFLLGLGIGITRYVSFYTKKPEKIKKIIASAMILISLSSIAIFVLFKFFQNRIAAIFFGSTQYEFLILPIFITMMGLLWHALIYSYFRGKMEIKKANIIQIINLSIIPVVVFLFANDIAQIFFVNGLLVLISSFFILFYIVLKERIYGVILKYAFWQEVKELFLYSIGRVPGDVGIAAMFTLVPVFVTHLSSIKESGIVAFGLSLVSLISSFFAAIGTILLPKVGMLYAEKDYDKIQEYTANILKVAVILPMIGVILFWLWGKELLHLYLGSDIILYISIIQLIMISTIPYVVYVSLRSIIDAVYEKPYNTYNILYSLIVMIILDLIIYYFHLNVKYIIFVFIFAMFFLSFLTMKQIFKIRKFFE